jgi:hypothetical protein
MKKHKQNERQLEGPLLERIYWQLSGQLWGQLKGPLEGPLLEQLYWQLKGHLERQIIFSRTPPVAISNTPALSSCPLVLCRTSQKTAVVPIP